ncbi:hypothetical protein F2Q70_00022339 [Brassica cretica]|uniref:Uncharacterized protein n=1 Tax=Brassica cretica TaxID=69181 RepID=A0A8S9GNP4_BRACR|nr:hypothetical protein F2Q70_00022339 [Brassica cretica]
MEGSPYRKSSISWKGGRSLGLVLEFLLARTWSVLLSETRGAWVLPGGWSHLSGSLLDFPAESYEWGYPPSLSAFLHPQILVCGLEDDVSGASIIYKYPFYQAIRYSERYDQGVMMWGENPLLLLGRETYFVRTQEQAFWLGCL